MKATDLHPGVCAKRKERASALERGEDNKAANKKGDNAYRAAMRQWQDNYYNEVAVLHGLARLGPGRRRLTRAQWHSEKAQAQALKIAIDRATALDAKSSPLTNAIGLMRAEELADRLKHRFSLDVDTSDILDEIRAVFTLSEQSKEVELC